MSAEENKALVRRFVEEFWNEGNTTAADELMAIDAVIHMPTGEVVDLDRLKSFVGTFRETFPDWHSSVEELIAEGDKVAERWTGRGTHRLLPDRRRQDRGVPGSVQHDDPDAAVGVIPVPQQAEA
jgi:predicted ester cyclase